MCGLLKKIHTAKVFLRALPLALVVLLSGCMLGPDYERPETDLAPLDQYSSLPESWQEIPEDVNDLAFSYQWWKDFNDPVINDLVEKALKHNYDLKAAASRVVEAEALLRQTRGRRLPDVQYNFERSRSKRSFVSPLGERTAFYNKTYSQSLTISYIVDLFGRLKRLDQAALADLFAVEANRQALVHSIIAQVIKARVEVNIQQRLLATARSNVTSRTNTLQIVERRYRQGLVSPLDVHLARENLATAEAAVPLVIQSVKLAQHSLDVLTGTLPATTDSLPPTLPDIPEISPVPAGLPVALLDQRPDLAALEYQVEAQTNRIGASIAEMFPDLTLTAVGGYQSDHFRNLFDMENQVYSFIVSAAAPIYKGGRLKAQVQAARARTERAASEYAAGILNALREVEDSLVKHKYLTESLQYQKSRLTAALKGEELSNERYAQGLEGILIVLDTERRRRLAEDQLIRIKGRLYDARVELFLSLGGYWGADRIDNQNIENEKVTLNEFDK